MNLDVADGVLGALRWRTILRHVLLCDHVDSVVLCRVGACFEHTPVWNEVVESLVSVEAGNISLSGRKRLSLETRLAIPSPVFPL